MDVQKKKKLNVLYAVIGILTLMIATTGATFAYFTATAGSNGTLTGNMATIQFSLTVTKVTHVDETKGGMIPLSNNMVEAAASDSNVADGAGTTCVDDNGNAVCQIYKIVVTNTGTASLFLDGYVRLTGGSGEPTDYTYPNGATNKTTMRWAQVFCTGTQTDEITGCSTIGKTTTTASTAVAPATSTASGITSNWATIGAPDSGNTTYGHNTANIKTAFADVTAKGAIKGNNYDIINRNYIRVSNHNIPASGTDLYDREDDITSALVYNQYLDPAAGTKPSVTMYIVVWLSETGTNQTAGSGGTSVPNSTLSFFSGRVMFVSGQGSEVTATFSSYVYATPDTL